MSAENVFFAVTDVNGAERELSNGTVVHATNQIIHGTGGRLVSAFNPMHSEEQLKLLYSRLAGTEVLIENEVQYKLMVTLLGFAGCPIWPWHKGYKEPDEGEQYGRYVWMVNGQAPGLMKETYVGFTDKESNPTQLTIAEIAEIIDATITGRTPNVDVPNDAISHS